MCQMCHCKCQAVDCGCFLISQLHCKATMNDATIKKLFSDWTKGHTHDGIDQKID